MGALTPDRLAEVRARVDKATEGPWEVDQTGRWGDRDTVVPAGTRREICYIAALGGDEESQADAEFIAHARTDVPDLLAALDAATERAEKAEAALARVEALADTWEREDAYACQRPGDCPRCVTYQGAVIRLRGAMEGKP